MELKNIAVVGAGGNVAAPIIRKLLADTAHPFIITALTRGGYTPPDPRIAVATIPDYTDQAHLTAVLRGHDAVLCCLPGGQVRLAAQRALVDAAVDAGVKLFFADEFVADITAPQYVAMPASYVGDKIAVRAYLEERAGRGEIGWVALNGGPFFDMWVRGGPAGFDLKNKKATIYGTGNNLVCWTLLEHIATAAHAILRDPASFLNRPVFVCGVQGVTQNAILEALEAEMGAFEVERVDIKKMYEEAKGLLEKGEVRSAMRGLTLNGQFNEEGSAANFWHLLENDKVGVQPVSVKDAVQTTLAMRESVA
ncbi:NmrA-like protein [Botryosphaeria dothidea]|uniref:NmrA-like protein n=1 Tax=Botryosphaeria dothidea TaxID=55169 RepID=A0A8H4IP36_9PEZI|nr:NmrA-like protein [Botryosphaeria dothidea]